MADRGERSRRKGRKRSYSSDDNTEREPRGFSESSSRNKRSRKSSKKSRSRSRSVSSSSESDHERKSRRKRRTRSSSSSSSSTSGERKSKQKKRVNKSSKKRKSRSRSRSRSSSSGSSSSGSSSSDSDYKRKKSKKSKHKTTKEKKKRRKVKKKRKKTMRAVNQNKYGKYGILSEADQFTKQPEFYCWLQEVKQVNPEILQRLDTKKMFETFMEDYNTATLPHKKYYNLAPWEMKQDAKRKLKAMKKAQKSSISFADDETNHNRKFKGEEKRYGLSKEKIIEMKRSIKERAEQEYKKNVGFDQSTRK